MPEPKCIRYSIDGLGKLEFKQAARFPIVAVGLCSLSLVLVKTARDSLFFASRDLSELALAFGLIALLASPFAFLHLRLMKRVGCRSARTLVLMVSGIAFIAISKGIDFNAAWASIGLFVIVPVLFSAIFAGAWLLAGDLLEEADDAEKSWSYSRIGGSSLLGGTLGGLMGRVMAPVTSPAALLAVGGVALLVASAVVIAAHRRYPLSMFSASFLTKREEREGGLVPVSTTRLMSVPFIWALTGVAGLMALAGQFIDFQFYAFAQLTGNTSAEFFAGFYTLLNGAALVLQLFAAPAVQARFGVARALLILPLVLLGSATVVALSSSLFSRAFLKMSENGLKSAIHRSTWEQAFLALHRRSRAVAKVFIDGMSVRTAEGLGALALYALVCYNESKLSCLNWLNWALIGLIVLWIGLTAVLAQLGCDPVGDTRYQVRLPGS
ncbi:MAG: hypothetical protein JSU96_05025 [Acidobacteriota bacterium]|nr:MAG: hypothetical protein JSU96_05025 [Acidobacteriota bacterium]